MTLEEMIETAEKEGYHDQNAEAKVCQDIILEAISKSTLSHHVTIKGGVVMRGITGNARRATQDMDIDFIRYSLHDDAIAGFIRKINVLPDIKIEQDIQQKAFYDQKELARYLICRS